MIIAYSGATVVSAHGIRNKLVIDTRRGIILPPRTAPHQKVDAEGLVLYPGLINAHDHLELNHFPRTKFRTVYSNATEWVADMSARLDTAPFRELRQRPHAEVIGAVKNLMSGVTTVAQHNPLTRLMRATWFPVDVVRDYGWAHSVYLSDPHTLQQSYRRTRRGPWMIHLAEGTDADAAAEIETLAAYGCLGQKTVAIHGVALTADAVPRLGGLVWCPSTNLYLLGQTADVQPWVGKLALGSDSRLTADGDLLDELRAARATGQLSDESLFHLVTDHAAKLLHLADRGALEPGLRADVLAIRQNVADPYQNLIDAQQTDIVWVMRRGRMISPLDARILRHIEWEK